MALQLSAASLVKLGQVQHKVAEFMKHVHISEHVFIIFICLVYPAALSLHKWCHRTVPDVV